jgi:uncharacterized phage-associated protein
MKPVHSFTVANYFLLRAKLESRAFVPQQLIKFVVLADGFHLGYRDAPLIKEDTIFTAYGPTVAILQNRIVRYGKNGVPPVPLFLFPWQRRKMDAEAEKIVASVYDTYCRYGGLQLSAMLRATDSPWYAMCKDQNLVDFVGKPIPEDIIKACYRAKIAAMAPPPEHVT